jgi:ABC-type Fe3+ transport system substrate-binding protein
VADGPRIVYPGAVVASSRNQAEARRFLAFLREPAARAIFERHKFVVWLASSGRGAVTHTDTMIAKLRGPRRSQFWSFVSS